MKEILAGAITGLVCILSAMEPCSTYKPWHNKQTGKTYLVPDEDKCLHCYFYFVDEGLGLACADMAALMLDTCAFELRSSRTTSSIVRIVDDGLSGLAVCAGRTGESRSSYAIGLHACPSRNCARRERRSNTDRKVARVLAREGTPPRWHAWSADALNLVLAH